MNLPSTIRVGFRDYTVVDLPPREAEAESIYGRHSSAMVRIEIRTDSDPFDIADTLIHELLHAAWRVAEIGPKDSEERTITALAHVLTQVIRDNPALVAYLQSALAPIAAA